MPKSDQLASQATLCLRTETVKHVKTSDIESLRILTSHGNITYGKLPIKLNVVLA